MGWGGGQGYVCVWVRVAGLGIGVLANGFFHICCCCCCSAASCTKQRVSKQASKQAGKHASATHVERIAARIILIAVTAAASVPSSSTCSVV